MDPCGHPRCNEHHDRRSTHEPDDLLRHPPPTRRYRQRPRRDARLLASDRQAGHRASRVRHGITREATWIQQTPAGDLAIVLLESDDLSRSLFGVATSEDPFDVWFRSHALAVHGIDLAAGMNLPEQVLDYVA